MRKLIIVASFLAACGLPDAESGDPTTIDQTLSKSYGGATEIDEQPAFGDPELVSLTEDAAAGDTMTDGRPELATARRVRIAIAWGYLRPHPEATTAVDWSGSIKAENAALRVVRKLRFEARDVILRPRTDMFTVAFESHTLPHSDGLLLDVILAPTLNPENKPVTLSFNTMPYTDSLTLEAGMRRSQVKVVDDLGHVVAYEIIRPDADSCREGFLRGEWKASGDVDGRVLGVLKGRFVANEGNIRGTLRGVFGKRANGNQVFFAKVVDVEGKLLGVLAGRWGDGHFAGLFLGRGKMVIGAVHGLLREAPEGGQGGFIGRYSERCGEDAREGQPIASDEPEISLEDSTTP